MHSPRLARWSSVLLLTTSLAGLSAFPAHAADPTLWESVKSGTQQVLLAGSGTARELYSWISGTDGESRLAGELVALTNKDLRDLELLVESAGYRLEDITIHRGAGANGGADVTLGFAFQRAADPRRTAELREIIARDNALVDEDTRLILGSLLDASARSLTTPRERFETQRLQVRLGQPPRVTLDVQARASTLAERPARQPHQNSMAALMPTMVSSASAATPVNATTRLQFASSEPESYPEPVAPQPAPAPAAPPAVKPAEPPAASAPVRAPAAEPLPLPAAEAAKAADSVSEAKPPADITGVAVSPPPEPVKVEAPAPVLPVVVAKPEPAPVAPAPVVPEAVKAEAPAPVAPVVVAKPEPAPVAPAPVVPEPVKVEAPAPVAPVVVAKPQPVPVAPAPVVPEAVKAEAPAAVIAKPATYRVTLKHTNGRAQPSGKAPKVRALSPKDVLVKTGNAKGRWVEFTVNGETGPRAKVWVYDEVFREAE